MKNELLDGLDNLVAEDIARMSYNELISIVRETNRPPGGERTIYEAAARCFLNESSVVLDIGTSTGVTALEFAKLVGCRVVGIDINELSLAEAARRASEQGLANVEFRKADAREIPYPDGYFDLVFCGNVDSLIDDRERSFAEYRRVVKSHGYICAVPMYYVEQPPDDIVNRVRDAIQVDIPIRFRDEAVGFYSAEGLEVLDELDFRFHPIPAQKVSDYCTRMLSAAHLRGLEGGVKEMLESTYQDYMQLFRANLALMGWSIVILRKEKEPLDPELFTGSRVF